MSPNAVGAKNLSVKLEEKQNKTQKQSYDKQNNKQLRFHWARMKLMTLTSFHSIFTRKPYLKEKLPKIGRDESLFEFILMAETHAVYLYWFSFLFRGAQPEKEKLA